MDYRNIFKLSCRPLALTSNKAFKNNKKGFGTSLPSLFSFFVFLPYVLLIDQILIVWLALLPEMLGNMCIVIVCLPGCDVINFEISLIFQIKRIFLHGQKAKINV